MHSVPASSLNCTTWSHALWWPSGKSPPSPAGTIWKANMNKKHSPSLINYYCGPLSDIHKLWSFWAPVQCLAVESGGTGGVSLCISKLGHWPILYGWVNVKKKKKYRHYREQCGHESDYSRATRVLVFKACCCTLSPKWIHGPCDWS